MKTAKYIWMDGSLLKWQDANIHITSHTLHYGNGVFEGIRAYKTQNGLAIFKLKKHIKRLLDSAKIRTDRNIFNCAFAPLQRGITKTT